MKKDYPHLFEPITIRGVRFKNRIFSNPIGIWSIEPQDGLTEYGIAMYEERAASGVATVVYGDQQITQGEPMEDCVGPSFPLRARTNRALLGELADCVHRHGAVASMELVLSSLYMRKDPNAPAGPPALDGPPDFSKMPIGADHVPAEDIPELIKMYAECAASLKDAGFKMATLHFAHMKMPECFLNPDNNHRTDEYGGSLENRMRFMLEIVRAVRKAVGENFVIEVRVTGRDPEKQPERFEDLVSVVKQMIGTVDIINVSRCDADHFSGEDCATMPIYLHPLCNNVHLAAHLKQRVNNDKILFTATGAITRPEDAEKILASGGADLVGMARAITADTDWANKVCYGKEEEIRPCIGCMKCLSVMHSLHNCTCSVNPRSGKEFDIPKHVEAREARKVIVIGGGPAGMVAALVAADAGHKVTLYEAADRLGGVLAYFEGHDRKYRLNDYRAYLLRAIERSNVEVCLNTCVTAADMETAAPDVIILAAGASPMKLSVPGGDAENVITSLDAYHDFNAVGKRAVIIGGNLSGCELAIELSEAGRQVTVVEMGGRLHPAAGGDVAPAMDNLLRDNKVDCRTMTRCAAVTSQGVEVVLTDGKTEVIPADTVISAIGMRNNPSFADELRFIAPEFYEVGDCASPATIMEAVGSAFNAARCIG